MSALVSADGLDLALELAALVLLAGAALSDWRSRRIPNWLTVPLLVGTPLLLYALGREADALWAAGAAVACAVAPALLWMRGTAGAGDVKLCAAFGALAGLLPALEAQLIAFGLIALWSALRHARRLDARELPFAPALLAATLSTLVLPL